MNRLQLLPWCLSSGSLPLGGSLGMNSLWKGPEMWRNWRLLPAFPWVETIISHPGDPVKSQNGSPRWQLDCNVVRGHSLNHTAKLLPDSWPTETMRLQRFPVKFGVIAVSTKPVVNSWIRTKTRSFSSTLEVTFLKSYWVWSVYSQLWWLQLYICFFCSCTESWKFWLNEMTDYYNIWLTS